MDPSAYLPSFTTIASFVGIAGLGLTALLYRYQSRLLYLPNIPPDARTTVVQPDRFNMRDFENVSIVTDDNVKLHAFLVKAQDHSKRPTFLYFHGNAGNIGHRLPNVHHLVDKVGVNVLIVSYRGYGFSEGEPSEAGLRRDGEASLKFLASRTDLDSNRLFVFGRSLGGAVAMHVAHKHPDKVRGLIVENSFTSIADMIDVVLPIFKPFKMLLTNEWKSHVLIREIKVPILFLAGQSDELVPHSMMVRLKEAATNSPAVTFVPFLRGRHNETWLEPGYYAAIAEWLNNLLHNPSTKE